MKRIAAIFLLVLLAGCSYQEVFHTLDDVESYISERPDSALLTIESIDSTMLKTKDLRARHALLHAMALDKNYIDVTDDSLASVAVGYYMNHGDKKYLARALYYQALAHYYAQDYEEAIVGATHAEQVAEKHDSLYLGFSKVLQANIYHNDYNDIEELKALETALSVYCKIGEPYYVRVAKMLKARSYINNYMYADAEKLLSELITDEALEDKLKYNIMREYAFLLGTKPDPDYTKSIELYNRVMEKQEDIMSLNDYWVFSYSLSKLGRYSESDILTGQLQQIDSSGTALYWQYRQEKDKGNLKKALSFLEQNVLKDDEEVTKALKQSISAIQRDYYEMQYDIQNQKAENRTLMVVCLSLGSILVILILLIFLSRYVKKQVQEKEQYIQYAESAALQLKEYGKDTYTSLQKKFLATYKARYETLGVLFDKYMQTNGRTDADQIIYKNVVSLIDELRSEVDNFDLLEEMLNEDLDGIMTKLHSELPQFKKKDHMLFAFLALGFDATTISHFMNATVNTIYIRKSRLKKMIEESSAEHKQHFLDMIG